MNKEQLTALDKHKLPEEEWNDYLRRNDVMVPLEDLSNPDMYEYWEKEGVIDVILEHTYTCLAGIRYRHYAWGIGCGECEVCIARKKAYEEYMNKKYK